VPTLKVPNEASKLAKMSTPANRHLGHMVSSLSALARAAFTEEKNRTGCRRLQLLLRLDAGNI